MSLKASISLKIQENKQKVKLPISMDKYRTSPVYGNSKYHQILALKKDCLNDRSRRKNYSNESGKSKLEKPEVFSQEDNKNYRVSQILKKSNEHNVKVSNFSDNHNNTDKSEVTKMESRGNSSGNWKQSQPAPQRSRIHQHTTKQIKATPLQPNGIELKHEVTVAQSMNCDTEDRYSPEGENRVTTESTLSLSIRSHAIGKQSEEQTTIYYEKFSSSNVQLRKPPNLLRDKQSNSCQDNHSTSNEMERDLNSRMYSRHRFLLIPNKKINALPVELRIRETNTVSTYIVLTIFFICIIVEAVLLFNYYS